MDPERPKPVLSEPQGPAQPAVFSPALSEPKPEPVTPRCGGWPPVELLRCPITVTAGFQRVSSMHAVADILPWTKGGTPAQSLASDAVSTCLSGSIIFTVAVVLSSHLDISAWHGLGCQTPSKPPKSRLPPLSAEGLRRSGSLCPCLQKSPVSSHVASGSRPSHQRSPTSSAISNLWPSLQIGHVFSIKS